MANSSNIYGIHISTYKNPVVAKQEDGANILTRFEVHAAILRVHSLGECIKNPVARISMNGAVLPKKPTQGKGGNLVRASRRGVAPAGLDINPYSNHLQVNRMALNFAVFFVVDNRFAILPRSIASPSCISIFCGQCAEALNLTACVLFHTIVVDMPG